MSVVLFHFGAAILPSITPNPFTEFLRPGKLGVQVFFVISGFVMPYAMHRSGYSWSAFGTFMARRWMRLGPPAYAAAAFMILYHFAAIWVKGSPVSGEEFPGFGIGAILSNLSFTVGLTEPMGGPKGSWYNFVYWTLAIEFQFYVLLALLYPMFMEARRKWVPPLLMCALLVISAWPSVAFFDYTVYFLLGILAFQWQARFIDKPQFIVSMIACCTVGFANGRPVETLVAVATAALILAAPRYIPRAFMHLGTISYSLYILHPSVGYFLESFGKRVTTIHTYPGGKLLLLLGYTVITVVLATVFHRLIEAPFMEWSRTLGRGRKGTGPVPVASSTGTAP